MTSLSHRGVFRVSGADKLDFLQGITSQDMRNVSPDKWLYGCFLTPQGKYLVDFFITAVGDDFLLDVDKALLSDFIKRLTMYKLRSKIMLEDVSAQYRIHAFKNGGQGFADPRWNGLGARLITTDDLPDDGDDYALWLMQNGIPDTLDFERERTAMLEANMDLLNAISFDKGCYMGQELTARTHYRGLVKKRFLPLKFSGDVSFEKDAPVSQDGKTIGFIRRSHKNYALAKVELEAAEKNSRVTVGDQNAEIIFPAWFATQP
jgi:folate-binding protein YgfZ